jgi:hypothetical protein
MEKDLEYFENIVSDEEHSLLEHIKEVIDKYNAKKTDSNFLVFCDKFYKKKVTKLYRDIRKRSISFDSEFSQSRYLNLLYAEIGKIDDLIRDNANLFSEDLDELNNEDIKSKAKIIIKKLPSIWNNFLIDFHELYKNELFDLTDFISPESFFEENFRDLLYSIDHKLDSLSKDDKTMILSPDFSIQKLFEKDKHSISDEMVIETYSEIMNDLGADLLKEIFIGYYNNEITHRKKYSEKYNDPFSEISFIREILIRLDEYENKFINEIKSIFNFNKKKEIPEFFTTVYFECRILIKEYLESRLKITSPNETIESIFNNKVQSPYKWTGNAKDLIELIEALILTDKIKKVDGTNLDKINEVYPFFSSVFNLALNNNNTVRNRMKESFDDPEKTTYLDVLYRDFNRLLEKEIEQDIKNNRGQHIGKH